jgi:hypothetical protein
MKRDLIQRLKTLTQNSNRIFDVSIVPEFPINVGMKFFGQFFKKYNYLDISALNFWAGSVSVSFCVSDPDL